MLLLCCEGKWSSRMWLVGVVVDDGYRSLSSSCVSKRAAVRRLKLQMQQLQVQSTASHQRIDAHVQQLVVSWFLIVFTLQFTTQHKLNCLKMFTLPCMFNVVIWPPRMVWYDLTKSTLWRAPQPRVICHTSDVCTWWEETTAWKIIIQSLIPGKRWRERPVTAWIDDIKTWSSLYAEVRWHFLPSDRCCWKHNQNVRFVCGNKQTCSKTL